MGGRWDPREQGDRPPCWEERGSPAAEGRTQGTGRIESLGSGFTRVPGIATPGTGGDRAWGLAGGMPRKEEITEDCGQVPAGPRAMWACGGVATKHGEKQHWV